MPRATRAALRAQELAEEVTTAATIALPATPVKDRVPLGEISNNVCTFEMAMTETQAEAGKKPAAKRTKGKGGRKGKKGATKVAEKDVGILEDDNQSSQSDAVEEACSDLINNDTAAGMNFLVRETKRESDTCNNTEQEKFVLPDRTVSPVSPAAESASQDLSPKKTPRFDPNIHKPIKERSLNMNDDGDRALQVDDIERTGMAISGQEPATMKENKDDSFVEQIKTRTPAKRVSRIEDSVEALDALEDEIERMGEAIPATTSDLSSPMDIKKATRTIAKSKETKTIMSHRAPKAPSTSANAAPLSTGSRTSAASKQNATKATNPRSSALKTATTTKSPASARKPAQPLATIQNRTQVQPSKRVSSIYKAPFVPTKSTKPPTKSSFELPGDAVAWKLKEQREERQKHEEEERTKNRQFKAKPIRLSQAPEVRLTASTKARLSLAKNAPADDIKPKAALRTGTASAALPNKHQSSLNVLKRMTGPPTRRVSPPSANTPAKRGPSFGVPTTSRQPSISHEPRPMPTAEDIAHQKTKGKEVFGRTKAMLSEKEKEKKAKEEAAKKARAEAAERGRIASREWAEKQKAKNAAVTTMKEKGEAQLTVA